MWYNVLNKVVVDPTNPSAVTNNPFLFAHLGSAGRWAEAARTFTQMVRDSSDET